MAVTRKTISQKIHKELQFSESRSAELFEILLEIIKSTLASGEDVMVSKFGRFCVQNKSPRKCRNPQTGEDLILNARRIVTFKCSGRLKDRMNREP